MSTLRRRIRAQEIDSKFEGGKYYLPDVPIAKYLRAGERAHNLYAGEIATALVKKFHTEVAEQQPVHYVEDDASSEKLSELKKVYIQVLQEKEELIIKLKEEIVDQNTLIEILETENKKLREQLMQPLPVEL